jgi:hypothetical protein
MGYGIGRVPADVDPVAETMAELEAAEIVAKQLPKQAPRPQREYLVCKSCGQGGYVGAYPFSTLASSGYCDDCI